MLAPIPGVSLQSAQAPNVSPSLSNDSSIVQLQLSSIVFEQTSEIPGLTAGFESLQSIAIKEFALQAPAQTWSLSESTVPLALVGQASSRSFTPSLSVSDLIGFVPFEISFPSVIVSLSVSGFVGSIPGY